VVVVVVAILMIEKIDYGFFLYFSFLLCIV